MTDHDSHRRGERDDRDLPDEVWELLRAPREEASGERQESRVENLSVGGRLGRYRLMEEVGRGGMGVVFRALDEETERAVALKLLQPSFALDEQRLTRFLREGEALRRLHHPAIVGAHDLECIQGVWCLAMELVEGPTLASSLDALRRAGTDAISPAHLEILSPAALPSSSVKPSLSAQPASLEENYARRVAEIGRTAARALEAAHAAEVVHRDIKPGNLMWDQDGQLKIVDFGLAAFCDDLEQSFSGGDLVGTLRYMGPERLRGGSHARDPRCDVYSLGATLYELLTFQDVFAGDDPTSVILKVLIDAPVSPRLHRPGVPRDLARVVLCCLEKDPIDRYASAADLADDLDRFIVGVCVRPPRKKIVRKTVRQVSRHPVVVTSLFVALLVVSLFTFVAPDRERVNDAVLVSERYDQLLREGHELLRSGWTPHIARMQSGTRLGKTDSVKAEERFRRAAGLDPDRPEAWNQLARVLERRLGPAAPEVGEAIDRALATSSDDPFALAQLARWRRQRGEDAVADRVIAGLEEAGQRVALDWLDAWDAYDRCDWRAAIDQFEVLINNREELFPDSLIDVHLACARACFNVRDFNCVLFQAGAVLGHSPEDRESMILQAHVRLHTAGPETVYEELLAQLGPEPSTDAILDVAAFWKERVRPDLMEKTLELVSPSDRGHPHVRAWKAWLRRFDAPLEATKELDTLVGMNPDDTTLITFRGELWCDAGQSAKALEIFTDATERFPRSAVLWFHRALEHWCFDEFGEAYDSFERSLALDINPNVLTYYGRVAWEESVAAREAGDRARSRASLALAREQLERSFQYFPWNFGTLRYLTKVLFAEGEHDKVDALLKRYERAYGEYHRYHSLLAHFHPDRALRLSRRVPPGFARRRWFGRVRELHERLGRRGEVRTFLRQRAADGDIVEALRHALELVDWREPDRDDLGLVRFLARLARSAAPDETLGYVAGARAAARLGARGELDGILARVDQRHSGVWSPDVVRALVATRPDGSRKDAAFELLEKGIVPTDASLPLLAELVTCGDSTLEELALDGLLRIVADRDRFPSGMQRVLGDALRRHRPPKARAELWRVVLESRHGDAEAKLWLAEALLAGGERKEGDSLLVTALRDLEDPSLVYRAVSWLARDLEPRAQLTYWGDVERRMGDDAAEPVREAIARTCLALEPLLDGPKAQRWSASDRVEFAANRLWLPGAFTLGGRRVSVRPVGRTPVSEAWEFEPEETAALAIPVANGTYDVMIVIVRGQDTRTRAAQIVVEGRGATRAVRSQDTPFVIVRCSRRVRDGCLDVGLVTRDEPIRIAAVEVEPQRPPPSATAPQGSSERIPLSFTELQERGTPADVAREFLHQEDALGSLPAGAWLALAGRLEEEAWTVESQATFWNECAEAALSPVVEQLALHYAAGGGRKGVRINCGASGSSASHSWSSDRFATGGVRVVLAPNQKTRIARTDCQSIYESFRCAGNESSVSYTIPVKPGAYRVLLRFTQHEPLDPEPNLFDVWLEGTRAERGLWIFAKSGRRILNEVVRAYSTSVEDGLLELRLSSHGRYGAKLFGLEVLPIDPVDSTED